MTTEEKQLLLKDLCARLPYGAKIQLSVPKDKSKIVGELEEIEQGGDITFSYWSEKHNQWKVMYSYIGEEYIKLYLRSLSSMTEEERKEYIRECNKVFAFRYGASSHYQVTDWLNEHHFDYRGLIKKGLALEAPEGMYKTE